MDDFLAFLELRIETESQQIVLDLCGPIIGHLPYQNFKNTTNLLA